MRTKLGHHEGRPYLSLPSTDPLLELSQTGTHYPDVKIESKGSGGSWRKQRPATAKKVHCAAGDSEVPPVSAKDLDPPSCLYSSDSEDSSDIRMIRVNDKKSQLRHAPIEIQRVPALGSVDGAADITIIGPGLFRKMAALA